MFGDPIADRALKELMNRYTVAEEKSVWFCAGNMKIDHAPRAAIS
jgi:hypothetical protein